MLTLEGQGLIHASRWMLMCHVPSGTVVERGTLSLFVALAECFVHLPICIKLHQCSSSFFCPSSTVERHMISQCELEKHDAARRRLAMLHAQHIIDDHTHAPRSQSVDRCKTGQGGPEHLTSGQLPSLPTNLTLRCQRHLYISITLPVSSLDARVMKTQLAKEIDGAMTCDSCTAAAVRLSYQTVLNNKCPLDWPIASPRKEE